jgi:hypothetical protein
VGRGSRNGSGRYRIRLDQKLWPTAAQEQARRTTQDPIFEILQTEIGEMEGKIRAADVWVILGVKPGNSTQDQNNRVGAAMHRLGWNRPKGGSVRIMGKVVSGYVRGGQPYKTIEVTSGLGVLQVNYADDQDQEISTDQS